MRRSHAATRWWQRVLPVTGLVVAVIAVAALLVPGVRDQLALSATHRPQQYVELAFARGADGTLDVCSGGPSGAARAHVAITSHLDETRTLDVVVTAGSVRRTDTVTVEPGETAVVDRDLPGVGRRYQLDVELPGVDERLHAACPGRWAS